MSINFTVQIGYMEDTTVNCDHAPKLEFVERASFDIGGLRELRDIMPNCDDYCGSKTMSVEEAIDWLDTKRKDCSNYKFALGALKAAPEYDGFIVKVTWY